MALNRESVLAAGLREAEVETPIGPVVLREMTAGGRVEYESKCLTRKGKDFDVNVKIVRSVRRWSIALATPKSITFTAGRSDSVVTSTFDGLTSRWMIPFWWACWMAWQTGTNSSSRCFGVNL